jgi:hypothetical protein
MLLVQKDHCHQCDVNLPLTDIAFGPSISLRRLTTFPCRDTGYSFVTSFCVTDNLTSSSPWYFYAMHGIPCPTTITTICLFVLGHPCCLMFCSLYRTIFQHFNVSLCTRTHCQILSHFSFFFNAFIIDWLHQLDTTTASALKRSNIKACIVQFEGLALLILWL